VWGERAVREPEHVRRLQRLGHADGQSHRALRVEAAVALEHVGQGRALGMLEGEIEPAAHDAAALMDRSDRRAARAQGGDAAGMLEKRLEERPIASALVAEHAQRHARTAPGSLGEKDLVLRSRDQGLDGPVRAKGAHGGQVGDRSRPVRQRGIVTR
jgi:hypothetical protein